jgi:tRNA threonylcarbamoyl adenosine modification protein (Sua5/YciO/YrdC/YwlC family)
MLLQTACNKLLTLCMFIRINPDKIDFNQLEKVVAILKAGGIIIYPTDSVYALGCDMMNQKAVERLCRLKNIKPEKSTFSFICSDLSLLSQFARPIPNSIFRIIKKALPGPYTFILEASSQVPKLLKQSRKTVGIRVPDNAICKELVTALGNPIISTSLNNLDDEMIDYFTDPENIYQQYKDKVDAVIEGGHGNIYPTSVINVSNDEVEIIREGLGDLSVLE